jgi:hypothetical protein
VDERELVGLIHRADWTKLTLSGTARGWDRTDTTDIFSRGPGGGNATRQPAKMPDNAWYAAPPFAGELTVSVAPGQRYRLATADGTRVRGCDGVRLWEQFGALPRGVRVRVKGRPKPPLPTLLDPAWLLSGYPMTIHDGAIACGRYGIRVSVAPQQRLRPDLPGELALESAEPLFDGKSRADVIVDAELGFLLYCAVTGGDGTVEISEFTRLAVGEAGNASQFTAPPGSLLGSLPGEAGADFTRWLAGPLGAAGWHAAKTASGFAAAGLGAVVRLSPARGSDPFEQATTEDDPEAAMHAGDRLPDSLRDWSDQPGDGAGLPRVSDDLLHLLWRSSLEPVPFSAVLHAWTDAAMLLAAVPESARSAGLGGVGFLIDSLQEKLGAAGSVIHLAHRVRFGDSSRFRVDRVSRVSRAPGRRDWSETLPLTVAGDGERCWQVYADRVETDELSVISRLPQELAVLAYGSWLLYCQLFDDGAIEVDGTAARRVIATRAARSGTTGFWSVLSADLLPAVAVVDAVTGRLLRVTRYMGGQVWQVLEFRSIGPVGDDGFAFTPPPGLRVRDLGQERAERMRRFAQERFGPGFADEHFAAPL